MGIKTTVHRVKQLLFMRKMLKQYAPYMKRGKYMLFPSMRALASRDGDSLDNAKQYFIHHTKTRENRIVSFVNKHTFFRNKKGNGRYEALYVANNFDKKREVKLFSFAEQKILTICVSEEECEAQLKEYGLLHEAYGMPATFPSSLFPCAHEISMISLSPRPDESEALATIASSCKKFNPDTSALSRASVDELLSFAYPDKEMNELLERLKEHIGFDGLPKAFPLCLQHGDLSQDNLMYGSADGTKGFFWIDWEHKRDRIFFYDFFFYILNSAFCSDVFTPLGAYISGACDEILTDFFDYFGLSYDPQRKKDYFLLYAIVFLKERTCDLGRLAATQKYVDFLISLPFSE